MHFFRECNQNENSILLTKASLEFLRGYGDFTHNLFLSKPQVRVNFIKGWNEIISAKIPVMKFSLAAKSINRYLLNTFYIKWLELGNQGTYTCSRLGSSIWEDGLLPHRRPKLNMIRTELLTSLLGPFLVFLILVSGSQSSGRNR